MSRWSPESPQVRFWKHVSPEPNSGCWLWAGENTGEKGYGRIRTSGRNRMCAHRLSYEMHKGAIPEGLQIDHLCRTEECCNPDHLEAVSQSLNLKRGAMARGVTWTAERKREYQRLYKARKRLEAA